MSTENPIQSHTRRKRTRIDGYDYSTLGAYFVTVCTHDRKPILWKRVGADIIRPEKPPLSAIGTVVEQGILQITSHYETITLDKYCIMPDHIHLLLRITSDMDGRMLSAPTLSRVVGSMKRWTSRQVGSPLWQKSFYDHGIRSEFDYDLIWEYIENNPRKYLYLRQESSNPPVAGPSDSI